MPLMMPQKRKNMFIRRNKHVKPKEEIKNKTIRFAKSTINPDEKRLLKQFIDVDPTNVLNDDGTKARYEPSIHAHFMKALEQIKIEGHWLEMGVRGGRSVEWLLEKYPTQTYHGFDSWEGLPEEWYIGSGRTYKKGDMDVPMPTFPDNIKLHKGWFKDTLPKWVENNPGPIAFIHIDSDLYSSCKETLDILNDQIVPGTILAFDEFINFRGTRKLSNWYEHEWRALNEWLHTKQRTIKPLTRNYAYQASCEVIS